MFDIKEYYQNPDNEPYQIHNISQVEDDINDDIDRLLVDRFDKLYSRDRYKNKDANIDIIHPKIGYPGNKSLILTPDKIRFLLSFYPSKQDLNKLEKIVIRPRYIEVGNIELLSLFMRKKRILVLYLAHPHYFHMNFYRDMNNSDFVSMDLEKISTFKPDKKPNIKKDNELMVHPLWYILSVISHGEENLIDKFFIKKESMKSKTYETLNDISFYFSRHGY